MSSFLFAKAPQKAFQNRSPTKLTMFKGSISPIETIPDEILALILERACLCHDDSVHLFRNRSLTVSRKWRRVILHTPSFWSVLHLSAAQSPGALLKSLELHLKRSKRYPLDIYLRCFWHPMITKAIFDCIIPHSERWRRLVIQTPTCDVFSHLQHVPGPSLEFVEIRLFSREKASPGPSPTFSMSNLSNLLAFSSHNISLGNEIPAMPRLRKLDLRGITTWFNFCGILVHFPALEHLALHLKSINPFQLTGDIQSEDRPPISLPALRYLHFITSEGLSHGISRLMRRLHCPNIISMTVQDTEGEILMSLNTLSNTPIDKPTDLLLCERDSFKLCIRYIDPYVAWNSLSPPPRLKVLELTAPQWPTHDRLEELCGHLTTLDTLVLRQFQTSSALEDIGAGSTIALPSLRALDIEFKHTRHWRDFHISQFFRIFSLPQLLCLRLQKPRAKEWENLLYCLYYPSLRSLSLVDMMDFISSAANPVTAFPYLTDLHLVNVRSNDFLGRLLQSHPVRIAWPRLRTITIRGDNLVSKPLIHKIVMLRHDMGLRIASLVLDEHHVNEDSRNWLNRYSCVHYVRL
ncbi:hypothetical protein APHAL10511_005019 [Amanita phalloides]|nr:hypothetical protein APHAL10511_005019 [Amanita phalloides]